MVLKTNCTFRKACLLLLLVIPFISFSQNLGKVGNVSGNFQSDVQYYLDDSKLGINDSCLDGKNIRLNGYLNVMYNIDKFTAGLRFESYLPPLLGYDNQYQGTGVPYWFATYAGEKLEVTAGNFYEQFGYGMSLRTYQEWNLAYDNSLRGIRVKFTPVNGIMIKGVYGVQRYYWVPFENNNRGIVKGTDLEFNFNELFTALNSWKTRIILGGSAVSNYLPGKTMDIVYDQRLLELKLPRNVATFSGRLGLTCGKFSFATEYAYKVNDPNATNNFIYKNGQGLFTSLSFSQKGLGISLEAKRIDNMSFKSDRLVTNNMVSINYLPTMSKEHAHSLIAMYPYATQPNGEFGFHGEINYTIPKNTKLGGKYGTTINLDFSRINSIKKEPVNDTTKLDQPGTLGYKSSFFSMGDDLYFQDINVEIIKKFSKRLKVIAGYFNIIYDKDKIEGHLNEYGDIKSHIGLVDLIWTVNEKHALRFELQGLFTEQDRGSWLAGLLEYTISPHWFFSVSDQYNYGNKDGARQLHYYLVSMGYAHKAGRISMSYGRQREGIVCVGGVCRYVPASSGLSLSITTSF